MGRNAYNQLPKKDLVPVKFHLDRIEGIVEKEWEKVKLTDEWKNLNYQLFYIHWLEENTQILKYKLNLT